MLAAIKLCAAEAILSADGANRDEPMARLVFAQWEMLPVGAMTRV